MTPEQKKMIGEALVMLANSKEQREQAFLICKILEIPLDHFQISWLKRGFDKNDNNDQITD